MRPLNLRPAGLLFLCVVLLGQPTLARPDGQSASGTVQKKARAFRNLSGTCHLTSSIYGRLSPTSTDTRCRIPCTVC